VAINKTVAGTWTVNFRGQDCNCDKIQGSHRHRVEKTFPIHREAAEYEKEMVAQVAMKEYVKPSNETVRRSRRLGSRPRSTRARIAERRLSAIRTISRTTSLKTLDICGLVT